MWLVRPILGGGLRPYGLWLDVPTERNYLLALGYVKISRLVCSGLWFRFLYKCHTTVYYYSVSKLFTSLLLFWHFGCCLSELWWFFSLKVFTVFIFIYNLSCFYCVYYQYFNNMLQYTIWLCNANNACEVTHSEYTAQFSFVFMWRYYIWSCL